ncbi:MAG TPA: A24 family peptidase [Streptosporangiaceae bacterium]|nr:A24 family peptidase [Streptosporangiaceae bacterium]
MTLSWLVAVVALAGLVGGIPARAAVARYSAAGRRAAAGANGDAGGGLDGTGDARAGGADAGGGLDSAGDARAGGAHAGEGSAAAMTAAGRSLRLPSLSVEAAAAAVVGMLAASAGPVPVLPALCWLGVCAVPLALIDMRTRRLPNALTAAAYAGTLVLLAAAAAAGGHWAQLARAAAGGAVLAACFLALAIGRPGSVGLGDVKLSASAGTALAWFGWQVLFGGILAGLLLAAAYGLTLLALRRATLRQQIPFGPFLLAGTLAAITAALMGSH